MDIIEIDVLSGRTGTASEINARAIGRHGKRTRECRRGILVYIDLELIAQSGDAVGVPLRSIESIFKASVSRADLVGKNGELFAVFGVLDRQVGDERSIGGVRGTA